MSENNEQNRLETFHAVGELEITVQRAEGFIGFRLHRWDGPGPTAQRVPGLWHRLRRDQIDWLISDLQQARDEYDSASPLPPPGIARH